MRSIPMETIYIVLPKELSTGNEEVYHVTVIKNGVSEVTLMNRHRELFIQT